MRNLQNLKHDRLDFSAVEPAPVTAGTWDPSDDSLILAFGPTQNDAAISLRRLPKDARDSSSSTQIASWDAVSPPGSQQNAERILGLHCFPDTRTLTLILSGGDIVTVAEDTAAIEIIGSVDEVIAAAAWAPDEEILAIASKAGTLLFMTREFEAIANVTLSVDDLKVSAHVDVGWGKRETQFQGQGAKAAALRDPTVPEVVERGVLSEGDDGGEVGMSWRGDGAFVAVNAVVETEAGVRRRVVRVYSREGVLESVSEPVDGLEGAVVWKPSGEVIAGVRRKGEEVDVVFFERNGLRHGEFGLRAKGKEEEMREVGLKWNVDSTVLAVSMPGRVQLWTMGNYHYHLKQEIKFEGAAVGHAMTTWHPEKTLHLCAATGSGLRRLNYRFEVSRGSVAPPHDLGLVAVVDGKRLKVTPLRQANVPPPMSFDEVELPHNALDVAISEDGREIAVLHHEQVTIWGCDYGVRPAVKASLKETLRLEDADEEAADGRTVVDDGRGLYRRTDHDRIFFDLAGSAIGPNGPSSSTIDSTKHIWRSNTGASINFSLTDSGILNIETNSDSKLRISNCTSCILTKWHCSYTTGQHLLKFIHLHDGKLEIPPDEPEKDERCRSIERGAKIVTVMPSAYALVLQMPRGNLETIYPRALVLAGVRQSINDRDYKKAFLTCRAHRVDMNILYDYVPEQFMADVEVFLKQVKKVEYIDLFLSSLSEEDVSKTLYRETLAPAEKPVVNGLVNGDGAPHNSSSPGSKVNKICDAFLQALEKQRSSRLQNIVTAHVCKTPPDLDSGLRLISTLRKQDDQPGLEKAVEHICFLADVNQLYDTALGLYDLDVALLVAQQSQKDPREYLPYLQSLQDKPPLRQKFTIDDDLKRHPKALTHLHALDAFGELKAYMAKHALYTPAVELYRYDGARLAELMRLHADHLSRSNKHKEAGIAYEFVADHARAHECYRAAGLWRECLASAALVPLPDAEIAAVAGDLADALLESKEFVAAATIRVEYLDDLAEAAALLCKGYQFAEAIRLVVLKRRPELLKSVVDPGLVEASATMTEMLAEMKAQLGAQVPRLRELRRKKVENPMGFLDGSGGGGEADVPDDISLAPTDASTSGGGTFMTRYTQRSTGTLGTNATRKTSRNRRREERKRARGKKGTVYEEGYLVGSVKRLVERVNEIGTDVEGLVEGGRGCLGEVFGEATSGKEGEKEKRPWGGEGVVWEAVSERVEAPVVRGFERLALI